MTDKRQLVEALERLCSLSEHTADDVFTMGRLVMDLGYYDLKDYPLFDLPGAAEQVRGCYRCLLNDQASNARALNDLCALLLSGGDAAEGRRLALLALAAAPDIRTVHENLRIADIYCQSLPSHEVPDGLRESEAFLLAYFDPHAH